jgi:Predicted amidohydrolase
MKVALFQMNIIWENKEANFLNIEKKLKVVSKQNIDLFLLPEMSFTGFSMRTDLTKENDHKTLKKLTVYAKKYNIAIGFGWVKDCGEISENHYTIVGKQGDVLSDYVKIHPFSYAGEDKKFQSGKEIKFFELDNIIFSTFICYDLRFPEIFQIASKRASVILVPANWPASRAEHWKCLLRARAIENQVYIIAINCVGEINKLSYSGDSCIIDPDGNILLELANEEGILEYDLNDNVQEIRDFFPVKMDRKEDVYYEFYKNF